MLANRIAFLIPRTRPRPGNPRRPVTPAERFDETAIERARHEPLERDLPGLRLTG